MIWDRGGVFVCEQFDAKCFPRCPSSITSPHSLGYLSKRLPSMFKTKGWGIDISCTDEGAALCNL